MAGRLLMVWMIGAGLVLSTGCGGDAEPGRVPLHGSVHVDGALVTEGSISLLPVAGHSGPAASTAITNGQYSFTETTGPVAGRHRAVVGVMATDEMASADANAASAEDRQTSEAAIKSATEGGQKGKLFQTPAASGDRSPIPTQWEMEFDVPSKGDYRADLEFGTK